MSLSDREILELTELCDAVVDGSLTEAQRARLSRWLLESEEVRRRYVRVLGLSASLCAYAGEMQAEAPDAMRSAQARIFPASAVPWMIGLAAAAAVAVGFLIARLQRGTAAAPGQAQVEYVARLTGERACAWKGASLKPGARLAKGQRIDLEDGLAEVTFDSGAKVVLRGPVVLDVNSAWDATLRRGGIQAYVPSEAVGFHISQPSVDVVDLGTEFAMVADSSGAADVLVLKGEVEAAPRSSAESDSILLKEKQAFRFAGGAVSEVRPSDPLFGSLGASVALDRYAPALSYVRWFPAEGRGDRYFGEAVGMPAGRYDLSLVDEARPVAADAARPGALVFDGRAYAKAEFPGLSGNSAHTIAFWVKIPKDAQLSDAFAMAAWSPTARKLAFHPVQIVWNRIREEGPLGALRTDFGGPTELTGGSAIGTTSLLDGAWHHVAVVFAPGLGGDDPVQVKQYLDGKLESSATNPPRRSAVVSASKETTPARLDDILWLGCRLGTAGVRKDRFRGEIDGLFVAGRSLEPDEINQVMRRGAPASASAVAMASDGSVARDAF